VDKLSTLLLAVLLDILLGEPPESIHPTVWFGRIVDLMKSKHNRISDGIFGILILLTIISFAIFISYVFSLLHLEFYLLFTSISIRSMIEHAKRTIDDGIVRMEVQKIVSRDVTRLNESQLCSAVIESIAENFVDGVFAPLFYFTLFGVTGAVVYRAINTCDAMVGYRSYGYLGTPCAKSDDILNFIPARLSVLLFLILNPKAAKIVRKYRRVKLNGGYPMSAMAGVLGVTLIKPGHYEIKAGRYPNVEDVRRAIRVYVKLCFLTIVLYTLMNLPVASITYLPNLGLISGIVLCSTPIR